MSRFTDQALVLSLVPYRDLDLMLNLLCARRGLVCCKAPSARNSQKRFQGGLDRHCLFEVELEEKPGRGSANLRVSLGGARLLRAFGGLRLSLQKLAAADALLEFASALARQSFPGQEGASGEEPQEGPPSALFTELLVFLETLEQAPEALSEPILLATVLRLSAQEGFLQHEARCAICGEASNGGEGTPTERERASKAGVPGLFFSRRDLSLRCAVHAAQDAQFVLGPGACAFFDNALARRAQPRPAPETLAELTLFVEHLWAELSPNNQTALRFWRELPQGRS